MIHHAALLTIGTEITSGQIENRNAAWLATALGDLFITPSIHLSVPDTHEDIKSALEFTARKASVIVCTGGLGPTRDDITREVIASWLDSPLQFSEASWQKIVERLTSVGVPVAESNKQQCFFPDGATVFNNPKGTADAFLCQKEHLTVIALPGPPHEIAGIWPQLALFLQENLELRQDIELRRYQCLGQSESALAEQVEEILAGSQIVTGYRPHIPYVEVKLWYPGSQQEQLQGYFERFDQLLAPWLVTRDDEDLASQVLLLLRDFPEVQIIDTLTQGELAQRLGKVMLGGNKPQNDLITISRLSSLAGVDDWEQLPEEFLPNGATILGIYSQPSALDKWDVILQSHERQERITLTLPFHRHANRQTRAAKYIAEMSLKTWRDWLMLGSDDRTSWDQ